MSYKFELLTPNFLFITYITTTVQRKQTTHFKWSKTLLYKLFDF